MVPDATAILGTHSSVNTDERIVTAFFTFTNGTYHQRDNPNE